MPAADRRVGRGLGCLVRLRRGLSIDRQLADARRIHWIRSTFRSCSRSTSRSFRSSGMASHVSPCSGRWCEAREASDVDVLFNFFGLATSERYFGVMYYLEVLLGRPIDLVTEKALRYQLGPYVERRAVRLEALEGGIECETNGDNTDLGGDRCIGTRVNPPTGKWEWGRWPRQ